MRTKFAFWGISLGRAPVPFPKGPKEQRKAIIIMVKAEVVDPGGKELYTPNTPLRKLRKAVRVFPLSVPLSNL